LSFDANDAEMISTAVSILRNGGLVAFPTETVYGLGADATNPAAVRRIFSAKQRPATNPLIVHAASAQVARRYAVDWPAVADVLAQRFWPGPLTLVLRKTDAIADEVSAGGPTIGLRVPNHPLALELLAAFDGPVAAPSANRSNQISPTEASHVKAELGDAVDLILDGGLCSVGIESTVLDLSVRQPRILRPGNISQKQIEAVIGPVEMFSGHVDRGTVAASPGQQLRHYSPRTPAFRFQSEQMDTLSARMEMAGGCALTITVMRDVTGAAVHPMPCDPAEYARDFYRVLRQVDAGGYASIYIEMPPSSEEWNAVRDRICRATDLLK
jgi:L-threonylcarbamoyladenylate synthase